MKVRHVNCTMLTVIKHSTMCDKSYPCPDHPLRGEAQCLNQLEVWRTEESNARA
jgi:hypothetical protein